MTYSVFISSTYLDNVERRKAVEDAILRAGMLPVGMERFASSRHPAVDESVRLAEEADLLVGIIAWRYGWIPDGSDISITEMEYNAAEERLMFLPDRTMKAASSDDLDQWWGRGRKKKKLDAFKVRLENDQMAGRFTDANLGMVVLQALTQWKEERREEETGALAFEQLRIGDLEDRVGRDDDLAWLKEHLIDRDTPSVALTSLTGAGGMGKTFLAQVFANQHKAGRLFLPIYLGDTKPFNAGVQLLANLGIPTADIDDKEKLKAAMRRFYANGSGIVVLDDVRSDDVRLLMPNTTNWRVLLTLRDHALADGLCGQKQVRELKVLTPEEAIELFQKVLEDQFDKSRAADYQELADYLAFRPYAVRIAAGYLREAPDCTPRELLSRLKEGESPAVHDPYAFENLTRLLSHCLDQLKRTNPLAGSIMDSLAVCSDEGMDKKHFQEWQAASHPAQEVEQAVYQARAYGLILFETSRDAGRKKMNLRLHTDVQRHLRRGDLLDHGRSLSAYLKAVLVERKDGRPVNPTLQVHLWSLFLQFGEVEDFILSFIDDFSWHLYRTGRLVWAMELEKKREALGTALGDKDELQVSYGARALILRSWGRLQEAMDLLKKEEALCVELGNKDGLSKTYGNQALIFYVWGRLEEAMDLHKKEEALCVELGDKDGLQASYGNQALILQAWGRLQEAMDLLKKQEALCVELGDKDGLQRTYGNQALILQAWGRLQEAMDLHKKEEALCVELGNKDGLSRTYGNQAGIFYAWGRLQEAMDLLKKEEALCVELGNKDGLQRTYGNQVLILQDWGRLQEAEALREKQRKIKEQIR